MTRHRVVVVGGGFAGLSAAASLAERGHKPVLLERRPRLGGRAYSFTSEGEHIDNGQHVLMQCCHSVRDFLHRIGANEVHFEDRLTIPFATTTGERHLLETPRYLPPTLALFVAFLRYSPIPTRDALGLRRILPSLRKPPSTGTSVSDWLHQTNQDVGIREAFWRPLCLSVMNALPQQAPAAEFVSVLIEAFGEASGAAMGWSRVGLSELYTAKAHDYIEQRGGSIQCGSFVGSVVREGDSLHLSRRDEATISAEAVILALPPPRTAGVLENTLPELSEALREYEPSPILGVNLWFDRPILDTPILGLLGTSMEWVFDRTGITGTHPEKGYMVSLVKSASGDLLDKEESAIVSDALDDLRRVKLLREDESPVKSLVVHERRATYIRPLTAQPVDSETSIPNLFLAGDWTNTGLPPTIEGAVRSGNKAADLAHTYLNAKRPAPK